MTRYIEIRNWEKFQHADATKRGNDPKWIKIFTRLHSDDEFLALTGHQRAVLIGLWLEYARSGRHLILSTRSLSARLHLRVMSRDIAAIETHGFITIRHDSVQTASSLDKRREEEEERLDVTPPTVNEENAGTIHDFVEAMDRKRRAG